MNRVPELRVSALNEQEIRSDGEYILYWMTATRRLSWNYSIDRALEHAEKLRKPLLIFEPLDAGYPWASDRHHRSIISGMKEHQKRLFSLSPDYYPYIEPQPGAGRGLPGAGLPPRPVQPPRERRGLLRRPGRMSLFSISK